jgi:hypothetical protein
LDPPTPHFSGPKAKEQAVVSTGGDIEPEEAENASKRQESLQTYDTSSQIPETPPEVLGDEEAEQLITYEKGMVQGC